MTGKTVRNKFFAKHTHITLRPSNEEKEMLLRFAEKEGLLEASSTELMRAYFRANNGFEEKPSSPQIPQQPNQIKQINYLEFAQCHSCPHRLIDLEKSSKWTCAGKKIARSICVQRQERFLRFGKECFPQHLAHHCRNCGIEIRPQYTYCYSCNDQRQERKAEKYEPNATQIYRGM